MSVPAVSNISVYPIKSCAGIALSHAWVNDIGLSFDRRFVVSDDKGRFITGRTETSLCLVQVHLTDAGLVLTAPEMPPLRIEYAQLSSDTQDVTVWQDRIQAQRCHESADHWFSQYLRRPCHLLFFGVQSSRTVAECDTPLAFADSHPLLLISQGSLDDLNRRLPHAVSMSHFRPNIVVKNCEPFAEDQWRHIRVGDVAFELSGPCSRCIFTTVDPKTGCKHPQQEPLATLKGYRRSVTGSVLFGQNVIPLNAGPITLGDEVVVV